MFQSSKKVFFVCFYFFTINNSFSQELSGIWTSGNNQSWNSPLCNSIVSVSLSNLENGATASFDNQVLGCGMMNTYFSNIVVNEPALGIYFLDQNSFNPGNGVITFAFAKTVENPILHIDKLGGFMNSNSNSVLLTLLDNNLSLIKLSGNGNHFEVTSNTINRVINGSSGGTECGTETNGSASGSIQINGIFDQISFRFEFIGEYGLGDLVELIWELPLCDFDNDSIPDKDDLDDDNDGILDTIELDGDPLLDTDGDGLIDSVDIDSDNDGCSDVIEAGFYDPDENGTLGGLPDTVDADGLIINETTGYTTPRDTNGNAIFDFQEALIPLVLVQPNNVYSLCEKDNLSISISVANAINMQWQVSLDSGITWLDLSNNSMYSGVNTENLELTNLPLTFNGYLYRIKIGEFCNSDILSDELELNVLKIPDTGEDGNVVFCMEDTPQDLFDYLGGSPNLNGDWSPSLMSGTGFFNPMVDAQGVYSYTIDNGYCDVSVSTVLVKIPQVLVQPISEFTVCEQESLIISIAVTDSYDIQWQYSEDDGVTWSNLLDDTIYSGVNAEDLQLSNIPLTYNNYWFRSRDKFCANPVFTDIVELTVLKYPNAGEDANKIFCIGDASEDLILSLGGNPDLIGFWSPILSSNTGIFNPSIDNEGLYTYTVNNGFCMETSIVDVLFSDEPTNVAVEVIDNSNNNSILITATGIGHYEYSLDGLNYQDDNHFDNLQPDVYTVYVRDKNECGLVYQQEQGVLGYPKFFTPNNDGHNEYWNIRGGENTDYTINIYDRYGKLLKSFDNSSIGWNGKFNNNDMPSSDYWFHFITSEGRKIVGHFALKR